jgi:hypothetical protein
MRYFIFTLVLLLSFAGNVADGQQPKHKHHDSAPMTEQELMERIVECLRYKDSFGYSSLFPSFDTLWALIAAKKDSTKDPQTAQELERLQNNWKSLYQFDPYYNKELLPKMYAIAQKVEDSGIHWNSVVTGRYELQKQRLTRDLLGYEKIVPVREKGFLFLHDMEAQTTWCIAILNMQQIQGTWYAGEVLNMVQASTIDDFFVKERQERMYAAVAKKNDIHNPRYKPGGDTTRATHVIKMGEYTEQTTITTVDSTKGSKITSADSDDDDKKKHRQVLKKIYYEGTFDNEIPVKLYIRYLRGDCPEKACLFEAIYKIDGQEKYIKLDVTKNANGKWEFDDDPPLGAMELELNDKVYTGTWSNTENQTGYDVKLTQKGLAPQAMMDLDKIIEDKTYATEEDIRNMNKKTTSTEDQE